MNLARAQKVECAKVNAACGKESIPGCCARETPWGGEVRRGKDAIEPFCPKSRPIKESGG